MVIEIRTPQFERVDEINPTLPDDFESLQNLSEGELKEIGCQKWDEPDDKGMTLWLFPGEWYDYIPNGLEIVDIFMEVKKFERGKTDDDIRYGALSFGFLKE